MTDPVEPGRNDPCPCGSGLKYKKCCLLREREDEAARAAIRQIEGRLVPVIQAMALERWGEPYFQEAWGQFFGWDDVPEDVESTPEFDSLFGPWFVFTFVPETAPEEGPDDWPRVPAAMVYMAEHEAESLVPELRFILAALSSPFSFHAVVDVSPGRDLHLRDIFTGVERRVLERSASRMVHAGDLIYAKVVTLEPTSVLAGCGPWVIPPAWHTRVIDFRQRTMRRQRVSPRRVFEADFELRMFYLDIADALTNPRLPTLTNTDGDLIRPTTMEFELLATPEIAVERLKPLTLASDDGAFDEVERHPDGRLAHVSLTWKKKGNAKHRDWDNTVLGTIRIEKGRLVAETNSEERARRLRKEIERRIGVAVSFVSQETLSPDDVRDAISRPSESRAASEVSGLAPLSSNPAAEEALGAVMARHWEVWLDERVPALGGKTPRQAAKTAVGRERLEALLVDFASRSEQQPAHLRVDVDRLRQQLGLPAPRGFDR